MADKIATLERERSIRTLVERLFVLEGRDAAAKRSHAEKALLRANPELSSADGFRLGRRIVIPGDIGLELKEQPEPVAEEAKGIFDETDARLKLAQKTFAQRFESSAKADEKVLQQANDREFAKKLRKALPESAALLPLAAKAIGVRAEAEKGRGERLAKAIDEAQEQLAVLRKLAEKHR
jgi:hypothetical protein